MWIVNALCVTQAGMEKSARGAFQALAHSIHAAFTQQVRSGKKIGNIRNVRSSNNVQLVKSMQNCRAADEKAKNHASIEILM